MLSFKGATPVWNCQDRCLRTCRGLARVLDEPVDALFALERGMQMNTKRPLWRLPKEGPGPLFLGFM